MDVPSQGGAHDGIAEGDDAAFCTTNCICGTDISYPFAAI